MPYVCLANSNLPDGVVQILDLQPNTSLAIPAFGAGQTRYVNRAKNDKINLLTDGTIAADAVGLAAYLLDRVEIGGLLQATGTVTLTGVQVGDTLTIGGVVFTGVAANPNAANQEFLADANDNNATATSLGAAITNAASITAMRNGNTNVYAHATVAANVVTLLARFNNGGGAVTQKGPNGSLVLASSNANRVAIPAGARLSRLYERWTSTTLASASAVVLARVDAASSLTAAALAANATWTTQGIELTNAGGSNSTGTVADMLSIVAGRHYKVARKTAAGALKYYMSQATPSYRWNTATLGGFTQAVTVYGTGMHDGEIKPANTYGDTENREFGAVRDTYDGDAFQISVGGGHLATFAKVAGQPGVTLWPDSDLVPHFPWTYQGALAFPAVNNVRVVTVYNNDGTVLA